jgi:hypothetical protein
MAFRILGSRIAAGASAHGAPRQGQRGAGKIGLSIANNALAGVERDSARQ